VPLARVLRPTRATPGTDIVRGLGLDVAATNVKSKYSAEEKLRSEHYDLIVLDLKLPAIDDALHANVEHGRYALQVARKLAPGTPIVILTGSPAENFIREFLLNSDRVDIWGEEKKTPVISFLKKDDLDQLEALLLSYVQAIRAVEDVDVQIEHGGFSLN
jgi:CheY-like chemotaxis protein